MRRCAALWLSTGLVLSACAAPSPLPPPPPPVVVAVVPAPRPLIEPWRARDCAMIAAEIARQRDVAAMSPVMTTALVEAAARLNVSNVIDGLVTRGRIEGCW
jgi:hypothetical protein